MRPVRVTLCLLLLMAPFAAPLAAEEAPATPAAPGTAAPAPSPAGASATPAPAKRAVGSARIDPGPPAVYRDPARGIALTLGSARAQLGVRGFLVRAEIEGLQIALAEAPAGDPAVESLERWVEAHVPNTVPYVQPGGRRDVHRFLTAREDGTVLVGTAAYVAGAHGRLVLLFDLPEVESRFGDARLAQIEGSLAKDAAATPPAIASVASLKAPPPPTPDESVPVAGGDDGGGTFERSASVDPLHLTGPPPDSATLFEGAPPEGRPLREVMRGEKVAVGAAVRGYLEVKLADGTIGFMDHTDLAMAGR